MYAWPFLCGVASYIQDHGLLADDARVYAISAGSMAAVLLVCGVDIEQVGLAAGLACNDEHATGRLLPYLRPDAVRSSLDTFASVFPRDAHERASGRLFLGVTELPRFRKRLISQFRTRIALIDALASTMAVPGHGVWLAYQPRHTDVGWCVDGIALGRHTDDDRPGWRTVRVGVGPSRTGLFPGRRYVHIAPSKPISLRMRFTVAGRERRMQLYRAGYDDAFGYFAEP